MAKIKTGILGETLGKVGPVVASRNLGGNFIRKYVIPKDPKTAAQLAIRDGWRFLARVAKVNYQSIIKPLYAKSIIGTNRIAWNVFFSKNASIDDILENKEKLQISDGLTTKPDIVHALYSQTTGNLTIVWNTESGQYASPTDEISIYFLPQNEFFIEHLNEGTRIERQEEVKEYLWSSRSNKYGHIFLVAKNNQDTLSPSAGVQITLQEAL